MLTSYVEEKAMPKEGQQQIPSRFCADAVKRQVQRRRHASLAPGPPILQSSEITTLLPEKKQCARVGVVIDEEQDGEIFASREHVAPNHSIAVFFSSFFLINRRHRQLITTLQQIVELLKTDRRKFNGH
jgi:hypothetical protein